MTAVVVPGVMTLGVKAVTKTAAKTVSKGSGVFDGVKNVIIGIKAGTKASIKAGVDNAVETVVKYGDDVVKSGKYIEAELKVSAKKAVQELIASTPEGSTKSMVVGAYD